MESTGKQIVFIVCLLGFFFTLVMTMPGGFYVVAPDYDETEIPTYWDIGEVQQVYGTDEENITYKVQMQYFEITGAVETYYVRLQWYYDLVKGENTFDFEHWNWGLFGLGKGNIEPWQLRQSEVLSNVDETTGNFSRFLMTCDHQNYIVYIGNNGSYTSLSNALDAGIVGVSIGVDYDYESSVLSGADIITRLLVLQLPDVTPEISFLIGLPIYTLIGFLAFVIITMIVDMWPLT